MNNEYREPGAFAKRLYSGSIARGNRNLRNIRTAEPAPHSHSREITRRLRQQERRNAAPAN